MIVPGCRNAPGENLSIKQEPLSFVVVDGTSNGNVAQSQKLLGGSSHGS